MGISIEFDPASEPALRDYLTVGTITAAKGAAIGTVLGLLLGALANEPGKGLALGAGVGAVVGAVAGVSRVNQGWRVCVQLDTGEPVAQIDTGLEPLGQS